MALQTQEKYILFSVKPEPWQNENTKERKVYPAHPGADWIYTAYPGAE